MVRGPTDLNMPTQRISACLLRLHMLQRCIGWCTTAVCAAVPYLSLGQPVSYSPVSRQRASARQHKVPQATQRTHAQRRRPLPANDKQVRHPWFMAPHKVTMVVERTSIYAAVVNLLLQWSSYYCRGLPTVVGNPLQWVTCGRNA